MKSGKKQSKNPSANVKTGVVIASLVVAGLLIGLAIWLSQSNKSANDFESCRDSGSKIMESYPEQCAINGKTYTNTSQAETKSDDYIGFSEQAALDKASRENKQARVVERDGESLIVDMSLMPGRLNLSVKDGKVYKVDVERAQ